MNVDPFDGRAEMSSEEYLAYLAQGQTIFVPPAPIAAAPDWTTNEKAFQAKVVKFATEHGWDSYHTWKSANSATGFPDLVMILGQRLEVAELKVGDNKPTKEQKRWLNLFRVVSRAAQAFGFDGIGVHLWTPDDWQEITRVLA